MKKILFFASALAGLFLAGSCQQENLEPVADGGVTYTITLPEAVQTKGESGYSEYDLYYEVYKTVDAEELKTAKILFEKKVEMTGNTTTLTLDLLNDQDYTILFWANKKGEAWFNTADLRNVEMVQSASNNNDRDAFCGVDQIAQHDGAKSKTVTLTRPFAQLNIATIVSTTAGYDLAPVNSYVKVSKIPVAYNVATASPVGEDAVVEYTKNTVPDGKKVNDKYDLVAMNYVLVPEGNIEVYYEIETVNGTVKNTVANVPVKPNYRTNIIGNLLTSSADYTVEIKPGFDTPAEEVELWDGKTLTAPDYDPNTNTWTIDNGAELAWLANAVNGTLPSTKAGEAETETTPVYKSGANIVLGDNINLGDREWTPIGVGNKRFDGTFDGKGHIISNFKITTHHGGAYQAALFGNLAGKVVIKNLTVEKAEVVYPGKGDFYGAAVVATAYGNVTLEYVTVKDSYISGNNKVAGLFAHDGVVSSLNINNCHVLNCKIESLNAEDGGNVGGLVGLLQAGIEHSIKNSSVKKTVINGINSSNTGKRANGEFVACVYGKDALTVKIENCEVSENTFTQNEGVTYVSPYGVFVGGYRVDTGIPTVIIDGKEFIQDGLSKEGDTYYVSTAASLQMAIDLVAEGDAVVFADDIETADGIIITDKKFTIDLNGNTYTVTDGANTNNRNFKIDGSSVVTIKNGTIVAAGDYSSGAYGTVRTEGAAMVTLKNLKLYNYRGNGLNVKALSGTKVIISETEVYSQYGGGIESAGGIIELTDVKVEQKGMYTAPFNSMTISVNGGGTVTVNSGTYSTECLTAEEANNQGTSHGPWVAGVLNSGGTLIIKGGTFSNDNFGENSLATYARGAILADTGADIQINGGTFDALKDIIDYQNNLGDASKNPVVTIKGGTFNADPFDNHYVNEPDGYFATETDGVWTVTKTPEASVNGTSYSTLAEAAAAAKAGDVITATDDVTLTEELTLPAGVTFNGNGKQINGTIVAGGDLTFAGHTKVTSFSASYYDRTITIGKDACLEVTSTNRVSLAYGNRFDIIGEVSDAKTADKTYIQPSLIIPGGISITGGNNAVMNIKDAYVQLGSTTSKNNSANGTFTLNIENSIAEFTNQLTFSEPTSGKTPTFNLNIKNSVVTLGTKLIAAAPGCNIKVDNSTVQITTYFRNSGKFELVNGSVLTGSTIQFGENGGNDGETIVDNSKFTINATNAGQALDGKGTGSLTIKNGAEAIVDYYKAMTVSVDATSTFTGTEVQ